jgi:hypothetical protein
MSLVVEHVNKWFGQFQVIQDQLVKMIRSAEH